MEVRLGCSRDCGLIFWAHRVWGLSLTAKAAVRAYSFHESSAGHDLTVQGLRTLFHFEDNSR